MRQLNEYNITLKELENSLLLRLANAQVGTGLCERRSVLCCAVFMQLCELLFPAWNKHRMDFYLIITQGDILEDIELIENLEQTKRTAVDIEEKVKLAKVRSESVISTRCHAGAWLVEPACNPAHLLRSSLGACGNKRPTSLIAMHR